MINPIIFSFNIGSLTFSLHWYGVILMTAVVVGAWLADVEFRRRGGDEEFVWNALVWILPAGVVGARLWYVINAILGGSTYFTQNPGKIFAINEGGLHIFGAILFGGAVAYWYARRNKVDFLMILDAMAPSLLLAQALARPANFINQELYGQPTTLPWGIPISAEHRIGPWADMEAFPDTTRFHPTFAYEMIWNIITGGLLLWLVRKYPEKFKPGAAFAIWMVCAGVGRFIIESFRPDQPLIPGTLISYSRLISGLIALGGVVWLLVRYEKIHLKFWPAGPEKYKIVTEQKSRVPRPKARAR
ncbi:MAG: prolipoprotein diacylglyceryl transferase [Anaerolineales bacterium]|nr:prolipoprotein diacylglyceryl transferase [Anaerolineales bacterium]